MESKGSLITFLSFAEFIAPIDKQRQQRGLTWDQVAIEAGVPEAAPALEQCECPSAEVLAALVAWLSANGAGLIG